MAPLDSHSSEPVPLPVPLLWGRWVPQLLCSCRGPSTYSLAAPVCRVDELHSGSHGWALQRPAMGACRTSLPACTSQLSSKESREIQNTESGCSQPLTGLVSSPKGTTCAHLRVSPWGGTVFFHLLCFCGESFVSGWNALGGQVLWRCKIGVISWCWDWLTSQGVKVWDGCALEISCALLNCSELWGLRNWAGSLLRSVSHLCPVITAEIKLGVCIRLRPWVREWVNPQQLKLFQFPKNCEYMYSIVRSH